MTSLGVVNVSHLALRLRLTFSIQYHPKMPVWEFFDHFQNCSRPGLLDPSYGKTNGKKNIKVNRTYQFRDKSNKLFKFTQKCFFWSFSKLLQTYQVTPQNRRKKNTKSMKKGFGQLDFIPFLKFSGNWSSFYGGKPFLHRSNLQTERGREREHSQRERAAREQLSEHQSRCKTETPCTENSSRCHI